MGLSRRLAAGWERRQSRIRAEEFKLLLCGLLGPTQLFLIAGGLYSAFFIKDAHLGGFLDLVADVVCTHEFGGSHLLYILSTRRTQRYFRQP